MGICRLGARGRRITYTIESVVSPARGEHIICSTGWQASSIWKFVLELTEKDKKPRFAGIIRRIWREPLVHFLLIGVALFALSALFGDDRVERDDLIRVTAGDVERLRSLWVVQYKRPPTAEELRGLVDAHVREEVLNREAKLLGLDRDDVIIRRRLVQKIEFLSEDIATMVPPTDEEVADYFEANAETYRIPAGVTFSHAFFNTDRRGVDGAKQAAAELRDQLNNRSIAPADTPDQGDPFVLPLDVDARSRPEVEKLFGSTEIVDAVFTVEMGKWSGPVASAYGVHIIYVHERTESRLPELEGVRQRVTGDLVSERRRKANEAFYKELSKKYTVEIEAVPR